MSWLLAVGQALTTHQTAQSPLMILISSWGLPNSTENTRNLSLEGAWRDEEKIYVKVTRRGV